MDEQKIKNIAKDIMQLDVEDIYNAHMQCEDEEFLVNMISEGLLRLSIEIGASKTRLVVKAVMQELFNE